MKRLPLGTHLDDLIERYMRLPEGKKGYVERVCASAIDLCENVIKKEQLKNSKVFKSHRN